MCALSACVVLLPTLLKLHPSIACMCGSAAYVMYLHALMVGCAGNVHREGDEAADEGHEVLPQILGRL